MSILINGIKMPTSCLECPLTDGHSASCLITEQSVYFFVDKRHNDCPLVPISPHGRLIDGDVLEEKAIERSEKRGEMINVLDNALNKVLSEYTDTAGVHHLIISTGDKTGDVVEYTSAKNCPFCGRKFTEDMICKCGINNAYIRI